MGARDRAEPPSDEAVVYEFLWTREIRNDFIRHRRGPVIGFLQVNFWSVMLALFCGLWGLATVLARGGYIPPDQLGLVLKATAAGFAVTMLPLVAFFLRFEMPSDRAAAARLVATVTCDTAGCQSTYGGIVCLIPWPSVAKVAGTPFGVLLHTEHTGPVGIYDPRLRDRAARRDFVARIEAWRKEAGDG